MIEDRVPVKRMGKVFCIVQYIRESKAEESGYLEVSTFLKINVINASLHHQSRLMLYFRNMVNEIKYKRMEIQIIGNKG